MVSVVHICKLYIVSIRTCMVTNFNTVIKRQLVLKHDLSVSRSEAPARVMDSSSQYWELIMNIIYQIQEKDCHSACMMLYAYVLVWYLKSMEFLNTVI